ncbi:discoidin domain-containing protein [Spirillospora sp. CA-294931]|uniref:discoidin domain-containing protein n=1 Tax=Spirillospora sp. CA-294931 TaxID=3240042 RepID=UPI003D8CC64F
MLIRKLPALLAVAVVGSLAAVVPPAGAAPAVPNPKPVVVPALQEWRGGEGEFRPSRVVARTPSLLPAATRLAGEITELTGRSVRAAGPSAERHGDLALTIDTALADPAGGERFAAEGYRLSTGARTATIAAPTARGVQYGTRSVLQMLLRDDNRSAIPVGTATDWPGHKVRAFMLDVGRRYFTPEFIRDYLRIMGWFKFNELQIHLNDNEIKAPGGDWSKAYSAFRLKSSNPEFAGLAAEDGSYTRADWDSFEDTAAANGVTLVPEIDAPAHSRAFIAFRPSLGLNGGNSDHLDLSKPAATTFMKSVFDEFTPWFRGPAVHYGADEYTADKALYKQYFNTMAQHVRSLGKRPRAWGSLTQMTSGGNTEGYDRDVTIDSWNNGWYGPQALKKDGYKFINSNDALLYIVPFADYYHGKGLDGQYLYEQWEPHVFPGGQSVEPKDPQLEGAMFAVWNDLVRHRYTELDVHGLVDKTMGVLGQKMWSGAKDRVAYPEFLRTVRSLALGPGLEKLRPTLPKAEPDELGFGARATASGSAGGHAPDGLTDGVTTSRWASPPGDRQAWAQVDLGKPSTVRRVRLDWAPAFGRNYDVQVSSDGTSWQTVVTRYGRTRPGVDEVTFEPRRARFVRVAGRTPATSGGYSLWSLQVFGMPDLARGRATTASSAEVERLGPSNATDGDPGTRWASEYTDNEWLSVDLGAPASIRHVLLDWEDARGRDYDVEVSDDGRTWRTVASARDKTGAGVDEHTFAATTARHVRMRGLRRATTYGYSLWRLEVREG